MMVVFLAGLMFLPARASLGQHTTLSTETCPVCTEAQRAAWLATRDSTIQLRPFDMLGHRIGLNRAETYSKEPKYLPIRHDKQIGCGTFETFSLHTNSKGEWDWNLRVRPTPYSLAMHNEIRNRTPANKLADWKCDGDCFKGEITTDNGFRDNPYFNVDVPYLTFDFMGFEIPYALDESAVKPILTLGEEVCMYGPWVVDLNHAEHPEIHPSEVVWWRDRDTGAIYALLLQDDSNRFDRKENFRIDDPPNWSRPWSAFPRWTDLRVAFAADPAASVMGRITVDGLEHHRVLTEYNTAAADDGGGSTHDLLYNGAAVMRVTELESPNDRIGVRYVDMCRLATPDGELIIGYVSLQTVIGDHDRGDGGDSRDEGYYVLKITVDEPRDARPVLADFRDVLEDLRRWRRGFSAADSLRRYVAAADVPPRPPRDPRFRLSVGSSRASGSGSTASLMGRGTGAAPGARAVGTLRLAAPPQARLPLLQGGTAIVRDGADSIVLDLPRHELTAALVGDSVMTATMRQLDFQPKYVVRDSSAESDESPIGDAVNAVIGETTTADRRELVRVFGRDQPFRITWSFTARDLSTGAAIPVAARHASGGPLSAEVTRGAFTGSRVTIRMPASGSYELTLQARLLDMDGNQGVFTHTVRGSSSRR